MKSNCRSFDSLRFATVAQDDSSFGGASERCRSFDSLPLRYASRPVAQDDSFIGGALDRVRCALGFVGAFYQSLGEAEAGAEFLFAAGHLAGVGFVVVAGEVEEAVEDEDLQFAG